METLKDEILILNEDEVNTKEGVNQAALHPIVLVKMTAGYLALLKARSECSRDEFSSYNVQAQPPRTSGGDFRDDEPSGRPAASCSRRL